MRYEYHCLNSIMVRLKDFYQQTKGVKNEMSQFHYGSIKREQKKTIKTTNGLVSIPLWFD